MQSSAPRLRSIGLVESPNCLMSTPMACSAASMALAIGVPSSARRWRLPFNAPPAWPRQEQRAPLVVVQVRVAHRRAVDDQRVVEHVAVAVLDRLQLLEQVRHQADVIGVDLLEVGDALVAIEMMRAGMERRRRSAGGEHAVRDVAAELEREDARRVGGERHGLQIEHQLDVLFERIGHPDRRARQLARLAARSSTAPPSESAARSRARRRGNRPAAHDRPGRAGDADRRPIR